MGEVIPLIGYSLFASESGISGLITSFHTTEERFQRQIYSFLGVLKYLEEDFP
jgi:hypothetical protein